MSITYRFPHTTVTIYDGVRRVVTAFDDGSEVVAVPNYDEESLKRAEVLGYYRDDLRHEGVWGMTRDHDLFHSVIADSLGRKYSVALHAVATGIQHTEQSRREANQEECMVMLLQRAINCGRDILLPSHYDASEGGQSCVP